MQLPEFRNEPVLDFAEPNNRVAMKEAVERVQGELGLEYDILIGDQNIRCSAKFQSVNPSKPNQVVGVFQKGTPDLVDKAISTAEEAFEEWSRRPAEFRVGLLLQASEIMRQRRLELGAWMVHEVGKPWLEADADVAEAIDFIEFYAREALRLSRPQPLTPLPDEENYLFYIPLGVGIVISPWNFPLAILTGMTMAAVVTGNTVIIKPSSDSPTIAAKLVEIIREARFPPGVVNFLTGSGAEIGDPLVSHPQTRFIAFTGSREVGLHINELAARAQPGQVWIKRAVLEMGGKDAIIVDEDADLDEAAAGVAVSAFGFQGQKCSACSRAIVLEKVYDQFLEKIQAAARKLIKPGNIADGEANFGPVINEKARKTILGYIEKGKSDGRLVLGGQPGPGEGFNIEPTIIADVPPGATIAQEEIFGPVLAVIKARDYEEALRFANDSQYGLTGAVYSSDPKKLTDAAERFHVGNLYLNRKCTGALVGAHPFGGFNMSGTDSKAGGKDYLLLFTQAKVVSKKIK